MKRINLDNVVIGSSLAAAIILAVLAVVLVVVAMNYTNPMQERGCYERATGERRLLIMQQIGSVMIPIYTDETEWVCPGDEEATP